MNDRISRIGALIDGSTTLASYTSLGGGMVTRIHYPQPDVRLDLWGGTTGTFAGIDRFGRIIDQRWQNNVSTTPADVDRHQYGYDRSSNRLYKANTVLSTLSEAYSYDSLNRLIAFRRGELNESKQVQTPNKIQDWSLDPLGNWKTHANADNPVPGDMNLNGEVDLGDYTTWADHYGQPFATWTRGDMNGNGEVDDGDFSTWNDHYGQSGAAGQIQSRTHNKVNQIDSFAGSPSMPAPAYDRAGNMTTFPKPADPTNSFTATYDAWNRLRALSDSAGLVVTYTYDAANRRIKRVTASETRHFYHTASWQVIEERLGTATTANRQYLWGILYIDELICRDRDTNADGTLDERIYALQDANFNVMALISSSGSVTQRFSYTPYGQSAPLTAGGSSTPDAYAWTHRHQGGSLDPESQLYHFRNREYHQILGRWITRDPMGYVGGFSRYLYIYNNPAIWSDPLGLWGQGRRAQSGAYEARKKTLDNNINSIPLGTSQATTPQEMEADMYIDMERRGQITTMNMVFEADSSNWLGHSDLPGGDEFDYNLEDSDPATSPYNKPDRHFRNLPDSQLDVAIAITKCDKDAFQRAMHRGQDFFSHYANGYRWDPPKHLGHVFDGSDPDNPNWPQNVVHQNWQHTVYWTQCNLDNWNFNCTKCNDGTWTKRQ